MEEKAKWSINFLAGNWGRFDTDEQTARKALKRFLENRSFESSMFRPEEGEWAIDLSTVSAMLIGPVPPAPPMTPQEIDAYMKEHLDKTTAELKRANDIREQEAEEHRRRLEEGEGWKEGAE